ncbi:hypothetical protein RZS08_64250, partial [Arthrospira platensis SPKY1]|nr:hypothetical protein [Arthrospira platensis SPKY1]
DFDRCTGELTNEISDTLLSSFAHGLCFSPSGRYLYCSNDISIIQYDLESQDVLKSRKDVAIWDKWKNEWGRSFTLGWMALGQDKKIYVIPNAGNSSHIHRIDKP